MTPPRSSSIVHPVAPVHEQRKLELTLPLVTHRNQGHSPRGKCWSKITSEEALELGSQQFLELPFSPRLLHKRQDPRLEVTQLDGFHNPNQSNKQQLNVTATILCLPGQKEVLQPRLEENKTFRSSISSARLPDPPC